MLQLATMDVMQGLILRPSLETPTSFSSLIIFFFTEGVLTWLELWVTFAQGGAPALEAAAWRSYQNGTVVVFGRDEISMQFESTSMFENACTPQELGKAMGG